MSHGNNMPTDNLITDGNMEAFDKLPKTVRHALANADHNWSAAQLREALRIKHPQCANAKAAIGFITDQDAHKHTADAARGLVCPR